MPLQWTYQDARVTALDKPLIVDHWLLLYDKEIYCLSSSKSEADTAEERAKITTARDKLRRFIKNPLRASQLRDFIVEIYETVLFVDTNNFSFQKLRIRTSRLRKNEAAWRNCDRCLSYSPFRSTPASGTNEASNVEPSGSSEVPGRKGTDIE